MPKGLSSWVFQLNQHATIQVHVLIGMSKNSSFVLKSTIMRHSYFTSCFFGASRKIVEYSHFLLHHWSLFTNVRKWLSFVLKASLSHNVGLQGTWRVYLGFVGLALVLILRYEKSILMFCWPRFGFDRWLSSHATLRSREKIKCDKTRRDSDLFTRKTDLSNLYYQWILDSRVRKGYFA